jgi:hypothetical protein
LYYYLSLIWKLVQSIFVIFLVVLLIIYWYITLQKSEGVSDYNILDPFCGFILGDIYYPEWTTYCSSITYTKNSYERKLSELKDEELKWILTNLATLYERENFLKWKDITFILEESENKLKITEVLDKFDSLKREFLSYDKSKIQCRNMFINSIERTLEVTCDAYSQGYESWIIWFSWNINEKVSWTSLSVANSFLNFIEKKSSDFTLVDRQKAFSIENTFWAWYTKKTKFDIKLKINF